MASDAVRREVKNPSFGSRPVVIFEEMMIYALNVFNFVEGQEESYKKYSVAAGKIIYGLGGRVVASGWKPLKNLHGEVRNHFIVVEFPSQDVFKEFYQKAEELEIHPGRENSTKDYIWTLYEPWDMKEWVNN